MTFLHQILDKCPDAATWQQQYPWFATAHLVAAAKEKNTPDFKTAAQQAAVYFNNVPRLHWLLHQQEADTISLLSQPETATATPPLGHLSEAGTEPKFQLHLSPALPTGEEISNEMEVAAELPVANSLSQSLAQVAGSFKNNQPVEDTLLFETAYQHTIDYFASQGIKLEGEPAQDDRFGQQLKTFTSWLRQMKRLPNAPEQQADSLVESQAAHSLQQGEVVTEPMADVLLKQGKQQQAVQVLEKLRLLHPEKSPYFAARIQQIKPVKP